MSAPKNDQLLRELARVIADPGSVLPRDTTRETVPHWAARALLVSLPRLGAVLGSAPRDDDTRDAHLFVGDDGQVYIGCAECGYGEDPPGPTPWDRAADDVHEALVLWRAHREKAHPLPAGD